MIHMAVSAANGGAALAPHIVPDKTPIAAAHYKDNILNNDVFPNIRSLLKPGEDWVWMRDLASPHTALATKEYLQIESVATLPRMPKGADCNPLDFYVRTSIKIALKR